MKEPYLSQLRELIREGVSTRDIHDSPIADAWAAAGPVDERFVQHELARAEMHRQTLLPLLESFVGPVRRVLDVGCGSGGTTVAIALSGVLQPAETIGIDPNAGALAAASVRAQGYDVDPGRIRFEAIDPAGALPYPDGRFDLTTCVSVLEFLSGEAARARLARELQRVTRPGGHVFVATPSPWRLRELHSGRLLGNFRRRAGFPWSSTPSAIRGMFDGCDPVATDRFVAREIIARKAPGLRFLASPLLAACLPWQKHLFRRRG